MGRRGLPGKRRTTGFEDPFAEVKVRLNDADAKNRPAGVPAIGVLVQTTIPVGSRALTADVWQPRAALAVHWDLPADWTIEDNLGYVYAADGGRRFDQLFASLSAGFQLNESGAASSRATSSRRRAPTPAAPATPTPASPTTLSNDVALDVRVGAGLDQPHPHWFTGLGAAVRF